MKKFILTSIFILTVSIYSYSQTITINSDNFVTSIRSGKSAVIFTAIFANDYSDFDKLTNAKLFKVDVSKSKDLKQKFGVDTIPTIILFKNGKEIGRFAANIMLKLETPVSEIQSKI